MSDAVNDNPKVKIGLLVDVPPVNTPGVRGGDSWVAQNDTAGGTVNVALNNGTGFVRLQGTPIGANAVMSDGSVPFTADESHGGHKITNLAAGVAATDAANVGQVGAAASVTADQVAFGATPGPGLASSARFKWFSATNILQVADGALKALWKVTADATRLLEVFDDQAVPVIMKRITATLAARTEESFTSLGAVFHQAFSVSGVQRHDYVDQGGALFVRIFPATAARIFQVRGTLSGVAQDIFRLTGAGFHLAQFTDSAGNDVRQYNMDATVRQITDLTQGGAVGLTTTLLDATKNYLWKAGGAISGFKIDMNLLRLQLSSTGAAFNAPGTLTGSWDWATGVLGLKTTDISAVPGAGACNSPTGTYAHDIGAAGSIDITNNLVTAASIVLVTIVSNNATMKTVVAVPGAGKFTSTPGAAATVATCKVNFLVINLPS